MTVYVDDMKARWTVECRMVADTEAELHAMADKIGVARCWHRGGHYDLARSKRALAVAAGARKIPWRQLGLMVANRRRLGTLGDPETAEEVWLAHRKRPVQIVGSDVERVL